MPVDEYTQWLGIAPGPRPPDPFALLGVPAGCTDEAAIESAAKDRLARLDRYALQRDPAKREACARLMNEVARARMTLHRMRSAEAAGRVESASRARRMSVPHDAWASLRRVAADQWGSNYFARATAVAVLALGLVGGSYLAFRVSRPKPRGVGVVASPIVPPPPAVKSTGVALRAVAPPARGPTTPIVVAVKPATGSATTRPAIAATGDVAPADPLVPTSFAIDGPGGRERWTRQPDGRWTIRAPGHAQAVLAYSGRLDEGGRQGTLLNALGESFEEIFIPDPGTSAAAECRTRADANWQPLGGVSIEGWAPLGGFAGTNPKTGVAAANGLASAYLERALRSVEKIDDRPRQALVLEQILVAQLAQGDLAAARRTYAALRPSIRSVAGPLGIEPFFAAVGDDPDMVDALSGHVFAALARDGIPIQSLGATFGYGVAARGRAAVGDIAGAIRYLDRMPEDPTAAYSSEKLARAALLEAVNARGSAAVTAAIEAEPDASRRDLLWKSLSFALAARGQIADALGATDRISAGKDRLPAIASILRFQAVGDWDGACRVAETLGSHRAIAFSFMSHELSARGKFDRAAEAAVRSGDETALLGVARSSAEAGEPGPADRALAACPDRQSAEYRAALAVTQAARGRFEEAIDTAGSIEHTTAHRHPERLQALAGIAIVAAGRHKTAAAHDAAERIQYLPGDPAWGDRAWKGIADADAAEGKDNDASRDARRMVRPAGGFSRVASRQIEAGRFADAHQTLASAGPDAVRAASADYVRRDAASFDPWAGALSDPLLRASAYLGAAEGLIGRPFDPDDPMKWWEGGSLRAGESTPEREK